MNKIIAVILILLPIIAAGCGNNDESGMKQLQFSFQNLPVLESGHYEAWLLNKNTGKMIKQFKIDQDQNMLNLGGGKIEDNRVYFNEPLSSYQQVKITIVPLGKKGNSQEYAVILFGEIRPLQTKASLSFNAVKLDDINGKYHLGTVTDEKNKLTTNGIWFAEITNGVQSPGLKINPTSAGWIYEGWIKQGDMILSLGKFGGPYEADLSNIYSGSPLLIKYAGEDFLKDPPAGIKFPLNLADGKIQVIITLQPYLIDDSIYRYKNPYFTILKADIPKNLAPNTIQDLSVTRDLIPQGKISALN